MNKFHEYPLLRYGFFVTIHPTKSRFATKLHVENWGGRKVYSGCHLVPTLEPGEARLNRCDTRRRLITLIWDLDISSGVTWEISRGTFGRGVGGNLRVGIHCKKKKKKK
jgi:hypothetical protein